MYSILDFLLNNGRSMLSYAYCERFQLSSFWGRILSVKAFVYGIGWNPLLHPQLEMLVNIAHSTTTHTYFLA